MRLCHVPIGHRDMKIYLFQKEEKRHTKNEVFSFDSNRCFGIYFILFFFFESEVAFIRKIVICVYFKEVSRLSN